MVDNKLPDLQLSTDGLPSVRTTSQQYVGMGDCTEGNQGSCQVMWVRLFLKDTVSSFPPPTTSNRSGKNTHPFVCSQDLAGLYQFSSNVS